MPWSTHSIKAAMRWRQVWGGWKRALTSRLFGAIDIDEQPLPTQPIPQPSWRSAERRACQQVFQKQRAQRFDTGLVQHRQVPRQGRRGGEIGSAKQGHECAGKRLDALAKRPQRRLSAHCIPNEHGHKINQFILAHPSPHKSHSLLYGFEDSVPLERVRHHDDLPKPGWRTRRVRWVHLDLDDRISHLPLLSFSLVFSQEDTFLPSLLVFQGFLPLLAHSLRIPWEQLLQEPFCGFSLHQAGSQVRQDRGVKARILQWESIGEAAGELPDNCLFGPF